MRIERANAKLNLLLSVADRRPDGYHDLVSVMQSVSLCDLVTIEYRPGLFTKISLDVSGTDALACDCRNLAYRAAETFLSATGRRGEVILRLEKRIPMAAGLGGGSADAAAVLRGLNRLSGNPLSKEELCDLGKKLGADVPFCIFGGTAIATGVGENLRPIASMPKSQLVVACGGEGVSTKEAYEKIDETKRENSARPEEIAKAFEEGNLQSAYRYFSNDFEAVVEPLRPMVTHLKERMRAAGAEFVMMSGSGPSVFGIFPDASTAETACKVLSDEKIPAFLCHPTGENLFD